MNITKKQYIIRSFGSISLFLAGAAVGLLLDSMLVGMTLIVAALLSFYWFSIQRSFDIYYKHAYIALALILLSVVLPVQLFYWIFLMIADSSENNIKYIIRQGV